MNSKKVFHILQAVCVTCGALLGHGHIEHKCSGKPEFVAYTMKLSEDDAPEEEMARSVQELRPVPAITTTMTSHAIASGITASGMLLPSGVPSMPIPSPSASAPPQRAWLRLSPSMGSTAVPPPSGVPAQLVFTPSNGSASQGVPGARGPLPGELQPTSAPGTGMMRQPQGPVFYAELDAYGNWVRRSVT